MKTNRTNVIQRIKNFALFPFLELAILFLLSLTLHSAKSISKVEQAQEDKITIQGKVLDNSNDAIDEVLVKDKNSDFQTVTDVDGKFTLSLNESTTVSFTKFGFQEQEMEITESDSNVVVILLPESNELLVRGLSDNMNGTKDHKWILDSLSTITDNYPLYIIDEMQKEGDFDVKMLNPDDIESVEVLNDSIAKDMYGNDGEKGAVKITTKNNGSDFDNPDIMQLNKKDTTSSILKQKYELYKDSVEANKANRSEEEEMTIDVDTTTVIKEEIE